MYYNMRVRTAQRNLAETRLSLMEREKTMLQLPKESIRTLNHSLKNVGTILETFLKLLWQLLYDKFFLAAISSCRLPLLHEVKTAMFILMPT